MKCISPVIFIAIAIVSAVSCKKNTVIPVGEKWNIVVDSFYTGVALNNHLEVYNGVPGDYFIFGADSNIYIREGSLLDTLVYSSVSSDQIKISQGGASTDGSTQIVQITTLSINSIAINYPKLLSPGGIFWRKIILHK